MPTTWESGGWKMLTVQANLDLIRRRLASSFTLVFFDQWKSVILWKEPFAFQRTKLCLYQHPSGLVFSHWKLKLGPTRYAQETSTLCRSFRRGHIVRGQAAGADGGSGLRDAQGQGRHGPRLWSTWEFFAYGGAASFAVLDGCVGSTSVCSPKPIGVYIWDFYSRRSRCQPWQTSLLEPWLRRGCSLG